MGGQDLACGEVDDGDGGLVGDGQDAGALVGGAGAEVVHASGAAQAHFSFGVEAVVAQPVVGSVVAGGDCFDGGVVGGLRGASFEGSVGSAGVVVLAEGVELGLEVGGRAWGGLSAQPAFEGLVEASGLMHG